MFVFIAKKKVYLKHFNDLAFKINFLLSGLTLSMFLIEEVETLPKFL